MSLRFKTNLLEHTKAVGAWAQAHGVEAHVRASDVALVVRRGDAALLLLPQFVGKRDGERLMYFDAPDAHARGFVGWLPYAPLAWDISISKLAFKAVARELGLRVPAWWASARDADAPYLVKRARGAFGDGMRGPFPPPRDAGGDGQAPPLADGEFCEAFKPGRIARAWYWNGTLAVLEVLPMPHVTGDGSTPLSALLQQASPEPLGGFEPFEALAAMQGLRADSVPACGRQVTADYRYVSPLNPTLYANHNCLCDAAAGALAQAFAEAGRRLWPRIPGALGPAGKQAGFVLDAIVDDDGLPWFLEINSNAQGHPDLYAPMLDALCAPWFGQQHALRKIA